MVDTPSWAWMGTGTWPSFRVTNQNNLVNLPANSAARNINPANYREIVFRDPNNDGIIDDNDTGDGTTAGTDRIIVNGQVKTVHEVALYLNSTVVSNGVTYNVPMVVWLFTDGSWMARMNDADIPPGHYSQVTSIRLGTWDGTEYSGTYVELRQMPFTCFTAGTLIATEAGEAPIETLSPGARVMTADHGLQVLRWIGRRTVVGAGAGAPVRIPAGALGNTRDLRVSQQHRMLLTGWRAELMFGEAEVLVAARHLAGTGGIRLDPCAAVTYVHILFDRHEIVFAEGIPSESFHPAACGLGALDHAARAELLALFPELGGDIARYGATARVCARSWDARALLAA